MPKKPLHMDEYLSSSDPFDQPITPSSPSSEKRYAHNIHPRINVPYRLALIGEAPGAEELRDGIPFCGQSGRLLDQLLSKAGVVRDGIFLGNICQTRPPTTSAGNFPRDHADVEEGLQSLSRDLSTFNPNICLLLGATALGFANTKSINPRGQVVLDAWRGSYFIGDKPGPFWGRKCLASYNPAACLRMYDYTPMLLFDIKKAMKEAFKPDIQFPQRNLIIHYNLLQIIDALRSIREFKQRVSVDIEGGIDSMSCISFSVAADTSFIIPFVNASGHSYWSIEDECLLWREMQLVLEDPDVPKIFQNGLYDTFVLQYSYGIVVNPVSDDTMIKHWEKYCEFDKNLGFLCSIYTDEPYYKSDRKSDDLSTFWQYCCRDSAVTYEINDKLTTLLSDPGSMSHYLFNMELQPVFRFMQMQGLRYDSAEASRRLEECNRRLSELQIDIDNATDGAFGIDPKLTREELLAVVQSIMCFKKDPNTPKKDYQSIYPSIYSSLLSPNPLDKEFLGRLSIETGLGLNVRSNQFKTYIYDTLHLPPQYDQKSGALTTDNEALLILLKKTPHPVIKLAVEIGLLRTRAGKKMLGITTDPDGRIRCGYNQVGADTGRISCSTSATGSGANFQTFPNDDPLKPDGHPLRKGMRDLVLAEPGEYLLKCDLKGADGWTVGANCKSLGDPTMFDDLVFGIKPAQVLAYMMRHGQSPIVGKDRHDLKEMLKEVRKEDWDYFACKQCIWGFCYLMGPRKAASHIFELSEGSVNLTEGDMRELRRLLFLRYNVTLWHNSLSRKLSAKPELVAASGHRRRFFSRYNEILGKALAHEPQANTTYATNKAAWRLWRDPSNNIDGHLIVRPMHQVHDELLMACKISDIEWAKPKVKEWFNNPMIIAGIRVTIPYDGSYGTDWSMSETSKIGEL